MPKDCYEEQLKIAKEELASVKLLLKVIVGGILTFMTIAICLVLITK